MNSLNSLLNLWDFEQGNYCFEIPIKVDDINKIAKKHPNSLIELAFFHQLYQIEKKYYKISLIFNDEIEMDTYGLGPIKLSNFVDGNVKFKFEIFFDKISSSNYNAETSPDIYRANVFSLLLKLVFETKVMSKQNETPAMLIRYPGFREAHKVSRNKLIYPKVLEIMSNSNPKAKQYISNMKIYPIINDYLTASLRDGIYCFNIIHPQGIK